MRQFILMLILILIVSFLIRPSIGNVSFESLDELKGSKWGKYIELVYGDYPDERDFPLNVSDFYVLDPAKLRRAGVAIYPSFLLPLYFFTSPMYEGELYKYMAYLDKGGKIWINHSTHPVLSDNELIEVQHCSGDTDEFGVWYYYAKGSGVYIDIGKTIAFPNHKAGSKFFLQKRTWEFQNFSDMFNEARRQGYDTIQFTNEKNMRWLQANTIEIVLLREGSVSVCIPELKGGWGGIRECKCEDKLCTNC